MTCRKPEPSGSLREQSLGGWQLIARHISTRTTEAPASTRPIRRAAG